MHQKPTQPKTRRPYESPTLKRQENLKEITLFTNFNGDNGGGRSDLPEIHDSSL